MNYNVSIRILRKRSDLIGKRKNGEKRKNLHKGKNLKWEGF